MTEHAYLDRRYNNKINPVDFIKNFKSPQEFEEWCYVQGIKDLKITLQKFKKHELYEYCKILQTSIHSLTQTWYIFKKDIFNN